MLGVCAGYQLVGRSFPDAAGRPHDGARAARRHHPQGHRRPGRGRVVAAPSADAPRTARATGCPGSPASRTTAGVTVLGPGARPAGPGASRGGQRRGDGTEGAWSGRVVGTYLHGPVLARNTALADLLLGWALAPPGADDAPLALEPLDDHAELRLRAERLEAVDVQVGRGGGVSSAAVTARR